MKNAPLTRGTPGGDAVRAAAYRGGLRLWNERTGELHKWNGRQDVRDVSIVLPQALAQDPEYAWAKDPYLLWNTAEFAENRKDSRVAREYRMILPKEMTHEQRRDVVYQFAQTLADRYGNAIDVALHDHRMGRARNYHAHLLGTVRKLGPRGLLQKADSEITYTGERRARGLTDSYQEERREIEGLWEGMLSQAIREAGLSPEVHRTLYRDINNSESPRQYRDRLMREGFDVNKQQREDRRKTLWTAAERQESAQKKWILRKDRYLQNRERQIKSARIQQERRKGLPRSTDFNKLVFLPRWDARYGLMNPHEVEAQKRQRGQTQAMLPLELKDNPGPEPQYVPEPEPAPEPKSLPESARLPEPREAPPPQAGNALEASLDPVDVWLEYRRAKVQEPDLGAKAVESLLEYRRSKATHTAQTDAVQAYLDYWREKRQQEGIQKERKQGHENLPAPKPRPPQPSPQRQPIQQREHSKVYEFGL